MPQIGLASKMYFHNIYTYICILKYILHIFCSDLLCSCIHYTSHSLKHSMETKVCIIQHLDFHLMLTAYSSSSYHLACVFRRGGVRGVASQLLLFQRYFCMIHIHCKTVPMRTRADDATNPLYPHMLLMSISAGRRRTDAHYMLCVILTQFRSA